MRCIAGADSKESCASGRLELRAARRFRVNFQGRELCYTRSMRWMGMVLVVSACGASEVTPVEAGGLALAATAAAINPCPWDGQKSYCYADMGFVYSGGRCLSVCIGPQRNAQRRVFATGEECALACSCKREKFASPFAVGDRCDEAWAELAPGAAAPWEGCPGGAARCALGVWGPLDTEGLATLCAASAYPEVVRVVCASTAR